MDKASTIVGVLMGGLSTERAVSLKSGRAVSAALRSRGWQVVDIDVGRDLPAQLVAHGVTACWLALHGRFGEDGCVQGLLEVMGIPYTGCGVRASAVAMDKIATKRALRHHSAIRMASDRVVMSSADLQGMSLPVVVKPSVGGSTIGITLAETGDQLRQAVEDALALHPEVLLEEVIQGEEITVAVLDGEPLPVVRIIPESGFFDYEAKYTDGKTVYEVPAKISEAAWHSAQVAAKAAYDSLGCRGLCRADFIVPEDGGEPVFLEINTLPGMTATSLSPMAAGATGIDFETLTERLLVSATVMDAAS